MIYLFKHPKREKYIEVDMSINAKHEYTDKKGLKWDRVWTCPQLSIDTKLDPFSENQFLDVTKSKKGSFGDLLERSQELSEKRKDVAGGSDPLKEKFFDKYSKERKGHIHENDIKRSGKKSKNGVTISHD